MTARTLLTAALTLCLLVISPLQESATAADAKVVAQVGTVPVTVFDLGREQQRILPFNASFHSGVPGDVLEKIKTEALTTLIEQAYKVNYAIDNKITINKKIVDERIDKLKTKYKNEKEFKAALGEENLKDFRSAIERSMLAQKAEEIAVQNNIKITDKDILSYYNNNKHTFKRPKQWKASHILIKVDPSSNQQERAAQEKKAIEMAQKAKSGEDFYNLAYYNSDDRTKYVGGDLGYFHEGQTDPDFEFAIKKMNVGDISNPVKTLHGWHIIKLVELNEAKQLDFDETKVKIRTQLEKEAKDKIYNNWMTDLKNKYSVKKF